jgi:hypothetical protein
MQAFGFDSRKGIILVQLQWKGLALMYKTKQKKRKEFSLQPHMNSHTLFFYPFSQQSPVSEECSKDVNLMSRDTNLAC